MTDIFPRRACLSVGLIVAAAFLSTANTVFLNTATAVDVDRLQYGEANRYHVTLCAQGDFQSALDYAKLHIVEHPDDLEAYFIMAMAQANMGQLDEAVKTVQLSLDKGLTLDRYLAGPRDLFAPLYRWPQFKQLADRHNVRLVHGPVLGDITDCSARFWVRTATECSVAVRVHTRTIVQKKRIIGTAVATNSADSEARNDFTAVLEVDGLEPNTVYTYFIEIDGKPISIAPAPMFTTYPAKGDNGKIEVVFGGGAGFIPWNERMWTTLLSRRPTASLLLGDNVYIDSPESPQTQRYCYYRRQSRPEYRRFASQSPIYAIWDDHDFGKNDCVGALSLDEPPWKQDVLKIFSENFVNPYSGEGDNQPGCYFDFSIGDVDFIMLDCRFYRQDPKTTENPSMLGPGQKAWLLNKLKHSTSKFCVVASSVPWASGTKPGSRDTWDGFPAEREEIFSFIEENQIEGVVLLSADRHRSDAWQIDRPAGYDLYDFSSSKLTNAMSHPLMRGCLFGYNDKCSFGSLIFNTLSDDPTVTYRIINIDGDVVHELTLTRSQLSLSR